MTNRNRSRVIFWILLVGALIRIHALGQDVRFHPDEALFSTFARHAALNGDWLLHGSLDKPPLALYANALSMTAFAARVENTILTFDARTGELAARLPSTFAHILLIAAVYVLAQRLYADRRLANWAALLVACSPVAVAFSATAFTDGLMLLCMTLALVSLSRSRGDRAWLWSGVWLALAFGSKQQGLFYLPLVIALGWALGGLTLKRLLLLAAPILVGVTLLFVWDAARAQETSLWTLAQINNTPEDPLTAEMLLPRLGAWLEFGRLLLGTPTILLLAAAVLAIISRTLRAPRDRATVIDALLAIYALAYLAAHVLLNFNVYDRYILPLLPVLALLGVRGGMWLWRWLSRLLPPQELSLISAALVLVFLVGGWNAAEGRVNVGGDGGNGRRGIYTGIDELAEYLNGKPLGAILYDRWLGWELGYYLGEWTDKRKVYYPTSELLVAGALAQPDPAPRYFVAPVDQPIAAWLSALEGAGFTVTRDYTSARFVVYELIPPSPR